MMAEKQYIEREAFLEQKRKQYCEDCTRRKGFKRGQYKTLYEIGEAPCRACEIDDVLNDVEDFPAADVRPVVMCRDCQHWDTDWIPNHARENEHFCPYIGLTTREDWFCADGEKREEC